ncbi:1,4-alpha-glucan branching protein GlgB [Propionibacterium freudenreichii]|uniref:1,4-alpha-glucan branching protein GlgB n=1 Tax=Propionibacterium freudenreichii TaxID=1744 RepID=UPI002484D779|nr:1,4-alpha-glucan branching protein GlgB [Propionibacterium freudenreichii]MDK9295741.1 1,4-alpha-glucan branching protein GlgB [Propionibacterium freudenreichii]MDK9361133.1 1,4-alpha-glucan branching protein GlgB [Propionibacterium freudenreichii]MDK9640416.1 1,4-alpha-glucan branching protein GlgB [Propionibacterium freudenreichii]MDK9660116.1 1,4-alpha-glucan branching protein GlgB [Propionibacterium freudenreichii]WGU91571.1 1,4-alpha-glucan branching protein GlgB [Propionibacterium fre
MMHDKFGNLTGTDLEGFHSGGDTEAWRRLGSHVVTVHDDARGDLSGTRFAVWAPNAQRVQVIGDFNWWQGDDMELVPGSGVWGLWKEGVGAGARYKYKIQHRDGGWQEKADPFAFSTEVPPANASVVFEREHAWAPSEESWLAHRAQADPYHSQMSIYELHVGSWRKGLDYRQLAQELPAYLTWMGYTHVELMPIMAHPLEASWGYQVTGYYAVDPRHGSPDDLRVLIEALHAAGIGVILDWVPGHFPKDDWALGRFDGTALFEHADPRQGEQLDWGTYVFNFGRNEVKSFLISNALFWVSEFHIDALRVDAVASMLYLDYSRPPGGWVPNKYGGRENLEAIDLLRYINRHLYRRQPGVMMIAEESTSFPKVSAPVDVGGLGFGFKWNMGWMNDSLEYIKLDPIYRQYHHNEMTFAIVYAYSENYILPISHDEVVHGKGSMVNKIPQDDWRKFATLRSFYSFMWAFPGKQLLFMGQEFGQRSEWNEAVGLEWWVDSLQWHKGLRDMMREINHVQARTPALYELDSEPEGFRWINDNDWMANTFSWLRFDRQGGMVACVANFSPEPYPEYGLRVPRAGRWREILNTDEQRWDGSGEAANGTRIAQPVDGEEGAELVISIPPMAGVWLRFEPEATDS